MKTNYMTKAGKFMEVFKKMEPFQIQGNYYTCSKGCVLDCYTDSESELWDNLWSENYRSIRDNLDKNFTKGNDDRFEDLISKAFDLMVKSFKEYVSKDGKIQSSYSEARDLDEVLSDIETMKINLESFPEYSPEFYGVGSKIDIFGLKGVEKLQPKASNYILIEPSRIGDFELILQSSAGISPGLYVVSELDNFRFDVRDFGYGNDSLKIVFDYNSKHRDNFIERIRPHVEDIDSQIYEYLNPECVEDDERYTIYDVYSMSELL